MAFKIQTKKKIIIAVSVITVILLLIWLAFSGGNYDILVSLFKQDLSNEQIIERLNDFGWRGYLTVAVLSMLQVICSFLPSEPAQILAGVLFGFPVGVACCFVGVLLGNTLIYMIYKLFGDKLRGYFVNKLNLNMEVIAHSSRATLIIFILYFLPAIPYGMICFLAASLGMSYRRFITVTCLGALPSICIGVGLGYISIAHSWILSLCIVLLLLAFCVYFIKRKEELVSKINRYAEKHKKGSKTKVLDINQPLLTVIYYAVRVYCFFCGVHLKISNKVGKPDKPAIVLCNHGSFIDFIYAAALLRKFNPNFIAARLYFYNKYLGWLLRTLGAFPKSMFAPDIENAKNCLIVLREKSLLAMMPEARLSTVGRFEDIQENTYSFIKNAGVSVYTVKINGDYFADPKWGKGFRRGSLVEAELDILYTAEEMKNITLDELRLSINERLNYNEFEWLEERPKVRYKSKRMAEGLENILHICPICGNKYTITTKKDKVFCEYCGYLTSVDQRYLFTGHFRFKNFADWYDWQNELLRKDILENKEYMLSSEVELRLPSNGKGFTRHGGKGRCVLSRDGLVYIGTKDGEEVRLCFSIKRIYRLLFGAGENFEIYNGTEILYFVPEEKRSAVEWYMASKILYDEASALGE